MTERDPYREAGYNDAVFWGYVDGKKMPFVSQEEYKEYLKSRKENITDQETDKEDD